MQTTMEKNNFKLIFTADFAMLAIALIMCVAQLINGSIPGFLGFGLIAFIIARLIKLENR